MVMVFRLLKFLYSHTHHKNGTQRKQDDCRNKVFHINFFLWLNTLLHKRLYNIDIRDLYRGGELSSL